MKAVSRLSNLRGLRRLILCSALVSSSQFAMGANDTAKASAYYENALEYYNNKQYDEAVIELKNAFQENPKLLSALVLLGKSYLETGNPAAAETALSDAIELGADPSLVVIPQSKAYLMQFKHDLLLAQTVDENLPRTTQADLHILRARAALEVNNREALDASLSAAERLTPLASDVLALKAMLLMRAGKLKQAEEFTNRLTDIYPESTTAWLTRASLKHIKGDTEGALEGYSKVINISPNNFDARIARVGLLLDLNRTTESDGDFAVLSEAIPFDPRVSYLRAVSLAKAGDEFGSSSALNDTLNILDALGPDIFTRNLQLLMVAAIANYSLGKLESARSHLETYVYSSPDELAPQRILAIVYMRQGEYHSAASTLEHMLTLRPNDPQILSMLAQAYDSAGKHQLSILTFEKALNQANDDPSLQAQLAISKMNAGFLEQGLSELSDLFQTDQPQASSGFALAVTLLNQNEFKKAADIARKLAEQNPEDIAKQNLLAISLVGLGELNEARDLFNSILKADPENISVKRNLSKIELREKNYGAAKALLDQLLAVNNNDPQLMLEMAQIFAAENNLNDALRWAKTAATAAPESFTVNSFLIDLLLENGDIQEALKIAQDQEAIHEGNLHVLEAQVRVLMAAKEEKQYLSLLRRIATEAGFNPQWLLKVARYQIAANSLDEASYTLFRGFQGNPNHFETRVLLTDVEVRLGRLEQAMERAKQLINDFPDADAGYRLVGDVRMERRQFSDAVTSYSQALSLGNDVEVALRLHIAQRYNDQHNEAEATLANWLTKNPNNLTAQNALAEFYLSTGNFKAATNIYRQLIKDPGVPPAFYNNLSFALYQQGEIEEALQHARKAYELAPNDPMVNDTLGWLLVKSSKPSEALPLLREALTRASGNPEIHYHLAVALHKLDRKNEAIQELRIAIEPKINFQGYMEAIELLKQLESAL